MIGAVTASVAVIVALSACGGSGDGTDTSSPTVAESIEATSDPPSSSQFSGADLTFLQVARRMNLGETDADLIRTGKLVCEALRIRDSYQDVRQATSNLGLSARDLADFIHASAASYCPEELYVVEEATSAAPPVANGVGKKYTNRGATVVIRSAVASKSIVLDGKRKAAGAGARYVSLKSKVTNNGKTSMDLTCGYPIDNKLLDSQQRQFDQIDDIYQVAGNPECNQQLQPGFSESMTWVYRVPTTAHIAGWEFTEINDDQDNSDATLIPLTVKGA